MLRGYGHVLTTDRVKCDCTYACAQSQSSGSNSPMQQAHSPMLLEWYLDTCSMKRRLLCAHQSKSSCFQR